MIHLHMQAGDGRMWSQAERGLFLKFTAVFLVLACGIGWAVTAIATKFFGYGSYFTLVVAGACLLVSMLGAWAMLQRLRRRILSGEDVVGRVKDAEARSVLVRPNLPESLITHAVQCLPLLYFLWIGRPARVGLAIAAAVAWFVAVPFVFTFWSKRRSRAKNSASLTAPAATEQNDSHRHER
jgi:hypothetical protein